MSFRSRFLSIPVFVALCTAGPAAPQLFDPNGYLRSVRYLAGDELRGRGNGTPELDKAADYIAEQFRVAGLAPARDSSTFFQKFTVTPGSELGPNNRLTLRPGTQSIDAGIQGDYVPIGVGNKSQLSGSVVFAGYGITAEEYNYMLRTHKPGETVEVVVLRDGQPLTVQVTLGVRR